MGQGLETQMGPISVSINIRRQHALLLGVKERWSSAGSQQVKTPGDHPWGKPQLSQYKYQESTLTGKANSGFTCFESWKLKQLAVLLISKSCSSCHTKSKDFFIRFRQLSEANKRGFGLGSNCSEHCSGLYHVREQHARCLPHLQPWNMLQTASLWQDTLRPQQWPSWWMQNNCRTNSFWGLLEVLETWVRCMLAANTNFKTSKQISQLSG